MFKVSHRRDYMRLHHLPLLLCALTCTAVQAARVERGNYLRQHPGDRAGHRPSSLDLYLNARQAQPAGLVAAG